MNYLSLCSGIGGLDRAVESRFGAEMVAYSEVDKDAASVMALHWPNVPNIGDLKVADWAALGPVDIVCGGIPCQPWSSAGKLGRTADDRHLWPYVADALRILRPRVLVVEEVPGFLAAGGLDAVLADLCALGFDAEWTTVRASDIGACHRRERLFLLAWDAECAREEDAFSAAGGSRGAVGEPSGDAPDADGQRFPRRAQQDGDSFSRQSEAASWHDLDRLGVGATGLTLLPTPNAADAWVPAPATENTMRRGDPNGPLRRSSGSLPKDLAMLLPTPCAHPDGKSPEAHMAMKANMPGGPRSTPTDLRVALSMLLPTPTAHIATRGHSSPELGAKRMAEGRRNLDDVTRWGDYAEAIARHERLLGRPAPAPLVGKRLNPAFVEWMMCFPEGWTSSLKRTARLRCLGNAVVSPQAELALAILGERAAWHAAA